MDKVETKLIEQYNSLQRYCHYLTRNRWDADDLAQETFAKVMANYKESPAISRRLIEKIAFNHWMDIRRKRNREDLSETMPELSDAKASTNENSFIIHDFLLKQLTPKQAVIFFLKEVFHYQNQEIGEYLHLTEGAVKAIIHRYRNRLNKEKNGVEKPLIDCIWLEDEAKEMARLMEESIQTADPSILIRLLPSFKTLKTAVTTSRSGFTHTPSCSLTCAA
ncbi:sigma-70 family RNA polymerase sigma factor [Bacillus tianshenii]|uniref:sigma-70 family RNA polymerase sigma factor n=1 Tax=Sutcliffiella tianshenii TaxID=1463404 RepID=UPI001CD3A2EA|nr:sigma-70 family RNA polymerase sigma factor [Bacillus tianshenii]MCA1319395.1 sigma-70 family RNA polymerase sigma factor [Bacillus tianshenii]